MAPKESAVPAHGTREGTAGTTLGFVTDAEVLARRQWRALRDDLDARAAAAKDSMDAVTRLSERYAALADDERTAVDAELADWLCSNDESLRYDALFLIATHDIRTTEPALRALADRLEVESTPGAPYEWAKVNRLLARHRE